MSRRLWGRRLVAAKNVLSVLSSSALLLALFLFDRHVSALAPHSTGKPPEKRKAGWQDAPDLERIAELAASASTHPELEELKKELEKVAAAPVASSDARPNTVRALSVTAGAPRSEVFVSGRLVGKTPYLGQWSCREGDIIRVDVVPPKGLPITRSVACTGRRLDVAPSAQ